MIEFLTSDFVLQDGKGGELIMREERRFSNDFFEPSPQSEQIKLLTGDANDNPLADLGLNQKKMDFETSLDEIDTETSVLARLRETKEIRQTQELLDEKE